jgi:hypothetical protein
MSLFWKFFPAENCLQNLFSLLPKKTTFKNDIKILKEKDQIFPSTIREILR